MNIVDTNTSGTFYPVFVGSTGAGQTMCADTITGPLSYNPSTCALTLGATSASMIVGATTGVVTVGTTMGTINVGAGATGVINLGGAAGGYINNTSGDITINSDLRVNGVMSYFDATSIVHVSNTGAIGATAATSTIPGYETVTTASGYTLSSGLRTVYQDTSSAVKYFLPSTGNSYITIRILKGFYDTSASSIHVPYELYFQTTSNILIRASVTLPYTVVNLPTTWIYVDLCRTTCLVGGSVKTLWGIFWQV
jgi:hypothetical protein